VPGGVAAGVAANTGLASYHPAHVSRILAELGWSYQKPERRAVERNEGAIAHWKRYRWVEIKKKPDD
jgi:transposase